MHGPPEHPDVCQAGFQPRLTTESIFRFFLEPQINWKCFMSVVFLIHLFLFPSTAHCNNVMGKLPR